MPNLSIKRQSVTTLIHRAAQIHRKIEAVKALYEELEEIDLELDRRGFIERDLSSDEKLIMCDNFQEGMKNTQWKSVAFKRVETAIVPKD